MKCRRYILQFVLAFSLTPALPVVFNIGISNASEFTQSGSEYNSTGFLSFPLKAAIGLYKGFISPIDDHRCPMHPSCSSYSKECIQSRGAIIGLLATADRLHRCGHDIQFYQAVQARNASYYADPIPPERDKSNDLPGERSESTSQEADEPAGILTLTAEDAGANPDWSVFADYLYTRGEYNRAITEYLRVIAGHPAQSVRVHCELRIAECYLGLHTNVDLQQWVREILHRNPEHSDRFRLQLVSGEGNLVAGRYEASIASLKPICAPADPWICARASFLSGIGHINTMAWDDAADEFRSAAQYEALSDIGLRYAALAEQGWDLPDRNRSLARWLALIPGAGYVYSGHYQTALSALIVISLTTWGTAELYSEDNTGWAVFSTLFSFGWYTGSIYGSGRAAERFNTETMREYTEQFAW